MINHSDRNLRILKHIKLSWILPQLYAANKIECTENHTSRISPCNNLVWMANGLPCME